MEDKTKLITIICLGGIIVLLLATLIVKIIESNPKNQEQTQIEFAYNHFIEEYSKDKEKNEVTDGKYSTSSLFKDGKELKLIGEFNTENGNLIHLCIADGSKKMDITNENITKDYLKEHALFERSLNTCKFND